MIQLVRFFQPRYTEVARNFQGQILFSGHQGFQPFALPQGALLLPLVGWLRPPLCLDSLPLDVLPTCRLF